MDYRVPCKVIRDLVPMYADGPTSETMNREVRVHLEECDTCREIYGWMEAGMEGVSQTAGEPSEIDYLKKVRRKNVRSVALGTAGVLLVMGTILFMKLFVIGYSTESYMIAHTDINGERVNVGGTMIDLAAVHRRYKLAREDGAERLVIYSCLPSLWNRSGTFNLEPGLPGEGKDLYIQGITVKSSGTVVNNLTNELYRARNPYIGDALVDGRLSGILGVLRGLGSFKNELQTSVEPYGWAFSFEGSAPNSAVFEERMKAYTCVLIVLTDNLGQISWNYTVELEQGPVWRHGTITEEECEKMTGAPVRIFADSPEGIEQLIKRLGIGQWEGNGQEHAGQIKLPVMGLAIGDVI